MTSRLVFLVGLSGSGKTVVAESLAEKLCWPVFDTDALVVRRVAKPIDAIFEEKGEQYFRQLEVQIVDALAELGKDAPGIVATGGGLPTIEGMMMRLLGLGTVVYLAASQDELWNRLTVDPADLQRRPLLRRGGRAALEQMISERESVYGMASITIQTDGLQVDEVVDVLSRAIGVRSTTPGYLNRQRQRVVRKVRYSVRLRGQSLYELQCERTHADGSRCNHRYTANGCEIAGAGAGKGRLCPRCQNGATGDPLEEP